MLINATGVQLSMNDCIYGESVGIDNEEEETEKDNAGVYRHYQHQQPPVNTPREADRRLCTQHLMNDARDPQRQGRPCFH